MCVFLGRRGGGHGGILHTGGIYQKYFGISKAFELILPTLCSFNAKPIRKKNFQRPNHKYLQENNNNILIPLRKSILIFILFCIDRTSFVYIYIVVYLLNFVLKGVTSFVDKAYGPLTP